ncbi:hypothetical protein DFS34DRAFT_319374 [Phlyctochytrium arcticum]|nr:hypothetical protein DFS34DRAFT_319374 [Phlyctochytrium arcticum]
MKKTWTGLHTGIGIALCTTVAFGNIAMAWRGGNKMVVQESGVYCAPDWGGCLRPQPYPKVNQVLTILNSFLSGHLYLPIYGYIYCHLAFRAKYGASLYLQRRCWNSDHAQAQLT